MFQVAPIIVIFEYLFIAVTGTTVAILSGILLSPILKLNVCRAAIVKDALLGAAGSVTMMIACAVIPWPWNTVVTTLGSGVRLETTMNRFQHPYAAALAAALSLSIVHQFIRLKHRRAVHDT